MRILAIDHGEKNIGLALSDETGRWARPLGVIRHVGKVVDAAQVIAQAQDEGAELILVGVSYREDGSPNPAGRRAINFATALRQQTDLPVELWDEAFTTQDAQAARQAAGVSPKRRAGHLDEWAAVVLLQDYLDTQE